MTRHLILLLALLLLLTSCVLMQDEEGSADDDDEGDYAADEENCEAAVEIIYDDCEAAVYPDGTAVSAEEAYQRCVNNGQWSCVLICLDKNDMDCTDSLVCIAETCFVDADEPEGY